jgi:surface protein
MSWMFFKCTSLTSLNLSNFNTNNVNDMSCMFDSISKNCKINHNDKGISLELNNTKFSDCCLF